MKIISIFFLALLAFPTLQAQDVGIAFGMRSDSADSSSNTSGLIVKGQTSTHLGVIVKSELSSLLDYRVGMLYVPRQYQIQSSGVSEINKFDYFEIPLSLVYKMNDFGGIFFGPTLARSLDRDCAGQACQGVTESLMSLQVGATFKFAPQLGVEVFYENALSPISNQIENSRAVGVHLLVTFD